jgi:hypothetical protein
MNDGPFRHIPLNDAYTIITAMLVCAQNNDIKGVAELAVQLGMVMSEIDKLILKK